ncbi:MAG: hypothetical protein ACHQ15_07245 [Candidatus Limnocylindrales bacterium]
MSTPTPEPPANHTDWPEWSQWSWSPRRRVPWLGILLVVFGLALLVQQVTPLGASTTFLSALAIAFGASWIVGGSRWAEVPAILLAALAIPQALTDLGYIDGPGWGSLTLGAAFLLIWLMGRRPGRRSGWAFWLAVIFGLIGLTQVSQQFAWLPPLDAFWPIVFIVLGLAIILGQARRGSGSGW